MKEQDPRPNPRSVVVVRPNEGQSIPEVGLTHKVPPGSFGGAAAILEGLIQPKTLIPPHTHTREDECTYVLSGELMFDVGGEVIKAPAGSYVVKPRGVYHAMWNEGPEPTRVIEFHVPGAFASFYDELGAIIAGSYDSEVDRQAALVALTQKYGETMHWERIPEYIQKYGVHP